VWPDAFASLRFSRPSFRARLGDRKFQEDAEMPDVHISWLAGRTVDQKRKVVEGITKVLMEEAGAKPESTHIVFIDIPHTDFASGGMLVADKNKKP
jgi:4-oxalocrotonate tautomerase